MTWQPLTKIHSIESATASTNFTEPLTDVLWRKAVREGESKSGALGLTEKSLVNAFQLAFGPGGAVPPLSVPIAPPSPNAARFLRSTLDESSQQRIIIEALSVGKTDITYQTTTYTRWQSLFERLKSLFEVPLSVALEGVRPANVRLEYKDSFRFFGEGVPFAVDLLRDKSPLIAPHVFTRPELWHSHTGMFEKSEQSDQRLVQVNIDANDMPQPEGKPFRVISITTAIQENFFQNREEESSWPTSEMLIKMFDPMHKRCSEIFKTLITDKMAKRIGLMS